MKSDVHHEYVVPGEKRRRIDDSTTEDRFKLNGTLQNGMVHVTMSPNYGEYWMKMPKDP